MSEYIKNFYGYFGPGCDKPVSDKNRQLLESFGFFIFREFAPPSVCSYLFEYCLDTFESRDSSFKYGESERLQIRAPLLANPDFLFLFTRTERGQELQKFLFDSDESWPVINQQNAVLSRKGRISNQSKWHRDYPFGFNTIRPGSSFSCFLALCDSTPDNGCTVFIPGSHRWPSVPLEQIESCRQYIAPELKAGDMIVFDSLCVHRGLPSKTDSPRIGLNTMFSNPILRQQVDLCPPVDLVKNRGLSFEELRLLGCNSRVLSVDEFLTERYTKENREDR